MFLLSTGEISTCVVQIFLDFWIGVLASCQAQAEAREAYPRPLRPKLRPVVTFSYKKSEKLEKHNVWKILCFLSKTETVNDFKGLGMVKILYS